MQNQGLERYWAAADSNLACLSWDGIFKLLRNLGIDSKESIPPTYVAWRAGATTLFPTRFLAPIDCSKIPALATDISVFQST